MLILKKINFFISSDLNVYQMKCASPSYVMQFYKKYYQDTTYALWSSVVTVVQMTPDLCFFGESTQVTTRCVVSIVC
jgi:multidrug transporter EmrE-like cation transporter